MTVTVRHATRADAEAIAGFAVALFELHSKWDPRRFSQIATTEGAARFYGDRSEAGSVLVAEVEGRTAGFVYFEYEETLYAELAKRTIWLHDIYVGADDRGKGAGRELLKAVALEAKRLGANKVLLTVAVRNDEGRRFFERIGFETTMHEMMLVVDSK
jgi:GNAT superfamily N-acetyltransferase